MADPAKKPTPKSPGAFRPVALHSREGVMFGNSLTNRLSVDPASKANSACEDMTLHPLGVLVTRGGKTYLIPSAKLDWVEVEEG